MTSPLPPASFLIVFLLFSCYFLIRVFFFNLWKLILLNLAPLTRTSSPTHLPAFNVNSSFSWLSNKHSIMCTCINTGPLPIALDRHQAWLHLAVVSSCGSKHRRKIPSQHAEFGSQGYRAGGGGTVGANAGSMVSLLRKSHTDLHIGCTDSNLHPHCAEVSFFLRLTGVECVSCTSCCDWWHRILVVCWCAFSWWLKDGEHFEHKYFFLGFL